MNGKMQIVWEKGADPGRIMSAVVTVSDRERIMGAVWSVVEGDLEGLYGIDVTYAEDTEDGSDIIGFMLFEGKALGFEQAQRFCAVMLHNYARRYSLGWRPFGSGVTGT